MELYIIYQYKELFPELKGKPLTDALIRDCLGREDAAVSRTEKGKPSVDGVCISVSHSQDTFALLVSAANVGVDIQYSRSVKPDRIAARYFSEREAAYISGDDSEDRFFEIWTRKEAYSKYTGKGLEQIMEKEEVLAREDVTFTDIRLEDGCYCAVCTGKEKGAGTDEIQISYRKQNG